MINEAAVYICNNAGTLFINAFNAKTNVINLYKIAGNVYNKMIKEDVKKLEGDCDEDMWYKLNEAALRFINIIYEKYKSITCYLFLSYLAVNNQKQLFTNQIQANLQGVFYFLVKDFYNHVSCSIIKFRRGAGF